jgi:hypothetical protein
MKKVFGCLFLSLFVLTSKGQMLYFETGKMISKFQYQNSQGESLKDLKGANYNNVCVGVRYSLFQTPLHLSLDAAYNKYGSRGSDPVLGNYYEWDVTYLGGSLGLDYEFFKPPVNYNEQHGFSFYIKASIASEFLINGTQNINNQLSDLKGAEDFDKPLYIVRGAVGLNYYISRTYVVFAQYMGGRNFLIGNYNNKEQLHIISHNISVGISINLFYVK